MISQELARAILVSWFLACFCSSFSSLAPVSFLSIPCAQLFSLSFEYFYQFLAKSTHSTRFRQTMTLQWTIVAGVLYAEIAATFILLLPWIRPSLWVTNVLELREYATSRWSKLFKSRLFTSIAKHAQIYSMAFGFVLFILFADGVRETMKYNSLEDKMQRTAESDATHHMRLFRAQRNLYISGFALLLFMVIQRIMTLLSRAAQLEAASEAAMRQAESATKTAKTLMNAVSFLGCWFAILVIKFADGDQRWGVRLEQADREAPHRAQDRHHRPRHPEEAIRRSAERVRPCLWLARRWGKQEGRQKEGLIDSHNFLLQINCFFVSHN